MNKWTSVLVLFTLLFSSCEKEEIPVAKHTIGETESIEVAIGNYYSSQVWFNIENGTEVARNNKTDWDLAFENNEPGWRITMNTANFSSIARTNKTDITAITDTIGNTWSTDECSGNLDSTGIGNWKKGTGIYILNRGKDEQGKHLGFTKFLIDSVTDQNFYFRYATLNETDWTSAKITKDNNYLFSYFSLRDKKQVQIAPPTKDWDLLFSQYTHIFHDMTPAATYLVTGVLLNPQSTYSAKVFDKTFEEITSNDISELNTNNRIDNIGYDWKSYNINKGYYTTNIFKSYVLKSQSEKLYKIHFLDWYNDQGEKGVFNIEYSEL